MTIIEQIWSTGLFKKSCTSNQLDSIAAIDLEWEMQFDEDKRKYAYVLATIYHETAGTMLPIEEYGKGKGRKYGVPEANGKVYYGRGYIQLTWGYNYKKVGDLLKLSLYEKPEYALLHDTAAAIAFNGMEKGWFTGKKLADYINAKQCDYINARRIINGTDKAELIAGYAKKFEAALSISTV